jgi:hypothetical protein
MFCSSLLAHSCCNPDRNRSFFQKPLFQIYVVTLPPTGGVRSWNKKLRGLLKHVRLDQVKQAIKSSKIGPHSFLSPFLISVNKQQKRGYPGRVRGWKNRLRGLFEHGRLGQVRNAIKSQKREAMWTPINLLACFGWKLKRTVFERTTMSREREVCRAPHVHPIFFSETLWRYQGPL